jgi:membrane protease YdiL (CAAX protease family)
LATAIAVFIARAAGDGSPFIPSAGIPAMFVVQLVTGAVGEELGWRGFLLPRLGKRCGEMTAAWVMAILWSLWHVAAFFVPGMPHQIMPPLSTLLFVTLFGVFLAFVFNRAGESVLATILAHLSLNIASGFGGAQLSSIVFWRTLVAIFGALALLIVLRSRRPPLQKAAVSVQAE